MGKQTRDFHYLTEDELVHIRDEHGRFTMNDIVVECLRGCGGYPCPTRRLVDSVMAGRLVPSEELEQVGWMNKDGNEITYLPMDAIYMGSDGEAGRGTNGSFADFGFVPVYIRKEKPE